MGIAGQEPAAVGLFAVYRDSMTGELRRFPACARGHRQCVPAPRVSDFADDYDFLQLAAATNPKLMMRGREVGGKSIPAERSLARAEEHDVVRHPREQADQVAGVDGTDPDRMKFADFSLVKFHHRKSLSFSILSAFSLSASDAFELENSVTTALTCGLSR